MDESKMIVPMEQIEEMVYVIRGQKVMLDRDLAVLYGVETKQLNQAVRRNLDRFPEDFMFQLTRVEAENWKSQFVTSISQLKMGLRKPPLAFTEQGLAMLSGVLRSSTATKVNIEIMRTFVRLRRSLSINEKLSKRMVDLEGFMIKSSNENRRELRKIWKAIDVLQRPRNLEEGPRIGFDLK